MPNSRLSLSGRTAAAAVLLVAGLVAPGDSRARSTEPPGEDRAPSTLLAQAGRKKFGMARSSDPRQGAIGAFNLLESAVFDPATGKIELLGKSRAGNVGPGIPYNQILADAMENPGPQFSLESDFSQFTKQNLAGRSFRELLFDDAGRLKPFAQVTLDSVEVPLPPGQDPSAADFTAALLTQGGYSLAADLARPLLSAGTVNADVLSRWIDLLLLWGEKGDFDQARAGGDGVEAATDRFYSALAERLGESLYEEGAPVTAAYPDARRSGAPPDEALKQAVQKFVGALEPLTVHAIGILLKRRQQAAIVLSSEDLQRAFGTTPVSRPRFINLDGTTHLARLLFEGDFALKSIPFRRELVDIEGYQTFPDWAKTYVDPSELGHARDNRYWVTVDSVELLQSSDGNIASFGEVKMRVESRAKDSDEPWSAERVDPRTKAYADMITEHYDAIAEQVPELYRLREVAKVVALANWLHGKKARPDLGPADDPWEAPGDVSGFLAMMPYSVSGSILWAVWPSGGVDFDFGSRIVVREDPSLTEESLRSGGNTRRLPTPEEQERRQRDRQLQMPSRDGIQSPRAFLQLDRIEAGIREIRRTESLETSIREAADGVQVLNQYFLESQRLQARTLRDAGTALGEAASSLASVDAAIAASPEPDRSTFLQALEGERVDPPLGETSVLVSLAREVNASLRQMDPTTFTAPDLRYRDRYSVVAGSEPFQRLASGVEAWDRRFETLEKLAPGILEALAEAAPDLKRFVLAAGRGRTALAVYRDRELTILQLLPSIGVVSETDGALRAILDRQFKALEASRQKLDELRS